MLLDTPQDTGHKDRCGRILTAKPLGPPAPDDSTVFYWGELERALDRDGQDKSCRRKWPRNDKDGTKKGQDWARRGQDGARMGPRWAFPRIFFYSNGKAVVPSAPVTIF